MPLKNTEQSLDTGKIKAEAAQSGDCMNRDERTTQKGPRFNMAHVCSHLWCPSCRMMIVL